MACEYHQNQIQLHTILLNIASMTIAASNFYNVRTSNNDNRYRIDEYNRMLINMGNSISALQNINRNKSDDSDDYGHLGMDAIRDYHNGMQWSYNLNEMMTKYVSIISSELPRLELNINRDLIWCELKIIHDINDAAGYELIHLLSPSNNLQSSTM